MGVLLVGLSVACSSGPSSADSTTKDKPIATAVDPNAISGDGTFAVGSQVKPGSYRTAVPSDSVNCYYARLKDASGSLESIIANNNGSPGSQQIVEIQQTDKYFKTQGCGTWTKVSA